MAMRAPQYRRVTERKRVLPVGPNPMASSGLRVAPWANIFALVDGLAALSAYRTEAEAQTALEHELKRRAALPAFGLTTPGEHAPGNGLEVVEDKNPVQTPQGDAGARAE
jgi:hypothetical protein